MSDILPDSRLKSGKGGHFRNGGWWVPVFCANCGVEGGWCPEENMTFLFYQCRKCDQTYGAIAGTMKMPDELFYEKLKEEQLSSYGRLLSQEELVAIVQEDASPLATLLTSGR